MSVLTPPRPAPARAASSFPGAAPDAPSGPVCSWVGPDGPLADAVADHVLAAGAELRSPADRCTVLLIAASALPVRKPLPAAEVVLLVVENEPSPDQWRAALEHGARGVLRLPEDSLDLLEAIRTAARPHTAARTTVVMAGHGGAGASSLAARLAGAANGPCALIDADPFGGGLDVLIEAPAADGLAWEDLHSIDSGAGQVILDGLPRTDDVALLTAREVSSLPDRTRLRGVLESLRGTAADLVVDCSPHLVADAAPRADRVLVVTTGTEHGVSAAARRIARAGTALSTCAIVVRQEGPIPPAEVGEILQRPVVASFRSYRGGVVPLLDRRRGGADRAARRLMRETEVLA